MKSTTKIIKSEIGNKIMLQYKSQDSISVNLLLDLSMIM